jgi:hypothetical protein
MTQPSGNKSTYAGFAQASADEDRGGRFKTVNKTIVVGTTPAPVYPAGPAWCADPTGVEPALGTDINFVEPCGTAAEIEASIATASPLECSRAQGNCGGAVAAPASSTPLADAVESAASPAPSEEKSED